MDVALTGRLLAGLLVLAWLVVAALCLEAVNGWTFDGVCHKASPIWALGQGLVAAAGAGAAGHALLAGSQRSGAAATLLFAIWIVIFLVGPSGAAVRCPGQPSRLL